MAYLRFDGKVVLVTGAASGIGRETASAFQREGATVVIGDIGFEAAKAFATLLRADNAPKVIALEVDVSSAPGVDALMECVSAEYGKLDIAVNNAGIAPPRLPMAQIPEADFDRVIAVNLKGVWLCMKAEIPLLLNAGGGAIVNMASVLGLVGIEHAAPYVAAKHGVVVLTKTAALEYAPLGLRINAFCPGVISTPLTSHAAADAAQAEATVKRHPIGRLGTASEVADAILWLASPGATFVTGSAISVDGGWSAH